MNKVLGEFGILGFYDAASNNWYRIDNIDIKDGKFTDINCIKSEPDQLSSFALPGFVDAHCHILENPYDDSGNLVNIAYINTLIAANHGITSVKDVGGYEYRAIEISRLLSKYNLAHIYTSGCYFTVPGGHCSDRGAIEISNLVDFKKGMKILLYNGIKYCKIINSDYGFEHSLLCQMIDYAHHCGMIVSTHAYTEKAAFDAVTAGTDTLEHAGDYSDELLEQIEKRNVIVIPTYVAAVDSTVENCEELHDVNKDVLAEWLNGENTVIPKLFERNISVGLGTDAGFPGTPFNSLVREIELLHKRFGVSIPRLLYSANITTPRALGAEGNIGRIACGFNADFLIYDRNPLEDISILIHPSQIWLNGKRIDNLAGNHIQIKQLTRNHIRFISENLSHYYFDCAELNDFWTDEELESWIACEEDYSTGAFLDGTMVGFCLTHYHKAVNKVYLENIFVCNDYRGQGIAHRLIFDVIAHYRDLSDKKIRFIGLVDVRNKAAVSVLEKGSFVKGHPMLWMQLNAYDSY